MKFGSWGPIWEPLLSVFRGSGLWIIMLRAAEGTASVLFAADLAKAVATCTSTGALLPFTTAQEEDPPVDSCSCCNCLHHSRPDSASSIWRTLLWLSIFLSTGDETAYAFIPCITKEAAELCLQDFLQGRNAPQHCIQRATLRSHMRSLWHCPWYILANAKGVL